MKHFHTSDLPAHESVAGVIAFLDTFDHDAARRDGWAVSDCGRYRDGAPRIELQKFDNPESGLCKFREDKEAWAHVVARARAGSLLHIQALDLVDRRERLAIESSMGTW